MRTALPSFLLLYAALFAAFGVASPFLPALMMQNGLSATQLGAVLAVGTATRLGAGPLGGHLADRFGHAPLVLTACLALAAGIAVLYGPAHGFLPLALVGIAHAAVLAPITPIADALALGSAGTGRGFEYGWVRAAGSAAFIAGALLSGHLVEGAGLGIVVWLNAALLAAAAFCATLVPNRMAGLEAAPQAREAGAIRALLDTPVFVRTMLAAALIGGSHVMHDTFEVIRWRAAGLTARECSWLWSLAVAAEVVVFTAVGRRLLHRIGPAPAITLAAAAGVLRWGVEAETAWLPAMLLVEPLHGLTFALLHLACMDVIASTVPVRHAATAQAIYATLAMGAASAAVTLAAGPLFDGFGPRAFWAMAALCAAALPLARQLTPAPSR